MAKLPERDVTKLPKWAQDRITLLERNVDYWKGLADGAAAGRTHVWLHGGGGESDYVPVRDNATVAFAVNCDPRDHSWRFDVRLSGRQLVVSGGDGLQVYPVSSNMIRVEHGRY